MPGFGYEGLMPAPMRPRFGMGMGAAGGFGGFRTPRLGAGVGGARRPRMPGGQGGMDPRMVDILHALLQSQPAGSRGRRINDMGAIPGYAQGGYVDEPTVAMLGEQGPEAVVPVGGGGWFTQVKPRLKEMAAQAQGGGAAGTIKGLLAGGAQTFTPDYLRTALRRKALGTSDAMRRRNAVLSRLSGLDPMQQRQAMIDADIEASGGLAGALNAADLQGLSGYQDFIRQLLGGERGYQFQREEAERQRQWEEEMQGGGFWDMLGNVGGKALGAFTGGYGEERGRRAGR